MPFRQACRAPIRPTLTVLICLNTLFHLINLETKRSTLGLLGTDASRQYGKVYVVHTTWLLRRPQIATLYADPSVFNRAGHSIFRHGTQGLFTPGRPPKAQFVPRRLYHLFISLLYSQSRANDNNMNNKLGRKITSLTIMTIMVAGGVTFAFPPAIPAYAQSSAEYLFVSAANPDFENSFAGPMVIEVIVNDPDLKEIDEAESEPDVTVNGQDLTMVQATDGNWYAYFADQTMATRADNMVGINGTGLDFGKMCSENSELIKTLKRYQDTDGVFFQYDLVNCDETDLTTSNLFGNEDTVEHDNMTVIREEKLPTANDVPVPGVTRGQINVLSNEFPAIQLYDFTVDGDVEVKFNRGGGVQQIDLKYLDDMGDLVSWSPDRSEYPLDAHVHVTINDIQLNIDPTDEDSWTFDATEDDTRTYYQIFDENGDFAPYTEIPVRNNINQLTPIDVGPLNFEDNGVLEVNPKTQGTDVLTVSDNDDQILGMTDSVPFDSLGLQITFTETQSNSGIFKNTDEGDSANIRITDNASRGTTATVEYNEVAGSVVVSNFFGSIEIDEDHVGGTWNSGEEIHVTVTDQDANKNSLVDEDFDLYDPDVALVPSVRIGDPITGADLIEGTVLAMSGMQSVSGITFHTSSTLDQVLPTVVSAANTVTGTQDSLNSTEDHDCANLVGNDFCVEAFSDRIRINLSKDTQFGIGASDPSPQDTAEIGFTFDRNVTGDIVEKWLVNGTDDAKYHYLNYDLRAFELSSDDADENFAGGDIEIIIGGTWTGHGANDATHYLEGQDDFAGLVSLDEANRNSNADPETMDRHITTSLADAIGNLHVHFTIEGIGTPILDAGEYPVAVDLFRFGQTGDGDDFDDRFNDAIYRIELEESGDNTGAFEGSMEYIMLNQINVNDTVTYEAISPVDDEVELIVHEDLTDEDSVRVNYLDLGGDGVSTQVADQVAAPTHSGSVSFDADNYKVADTVTVTVDDPDLNIDVETIDVFTVVNEADDAQDAVGAAGYGMNSKNEPFGRLLDITFDDEIWTEANVGDEPNAACTLEDGVDRGLAATGFTLKETAADSGLFTGDFQIPTRYCPADPDFGDEDGVTTTGTDMEVNYVDYRDASGEIIEVGDSVGLRANTGSVSLDRTVYPVPFGGHLDGEFNFPIHAEGQILLPNNEINPNNFLPEGVLTIHARINDPDFDVSASGEDNIAITTNRNDGNRDNSDGDDDDGIDFNSDGTVDMDNGPHGPVLFTISRGGNTVYHATAGAPDAREAVALADDMSNVFEPELAPSNAVLPQELGPINEIAPDAGIFEVDLEIAWNDGPDGMLLQGDILTVEYTDPTDASGDPNTVTDSATFDLRNGVLQSDKSVYIIGSDMIITLIEPDFDLDNDAAETYPLTLIEWDSDAGSATLGSNEEDFDPEPSDLRETGDSTGIFQSVIEIPEEVENDRIERGEEVELEYTDWGPSGADFVGEEDEDINLTIFTSNFGATIELDQKVYTWTDKVYITIVAPDHNFDDDLIDEIGETNLDEITVSTREADLDNYKLDETGPDTGIFTGEVILTGFRFDVDGDFGTGDNSGFDTVPRTGGGGPTDGFLETSEDDGLTVSFEFSEDETVVGSALIRWNIGEAQWLEAAYPATGTGVVRVVDPDLNLNPEAVDNLEVDVWSDSDAGGIQLTVTETNEATGIFEGTVSFTVNDQSSGHRLYVAEGDTVTARYEDNTLPDPFTTADNLDITGTAIIGTIVPPLERVDIIDARLVDSFGGALTTVAVDQQVQITADLASGQDRDQTFAYLLQVQDANGVTVSLAWITGSLAAGQSFSPALSWIPEEAGSYTATIFVWESVDNPTALSAPATVQITVA
ncbi:hypothetical protein CENSYa_2059 [Cenarchaeum symbiosum A]|uniref:Carbamoyl phosphate synthase ATP-binding domain-containing protein n=1 Tax=Cenarchaeum symbiosum (strain A) TaxID=414004 RepID=A0RZ95_CENSY|nr:hypothetical protein CENSYa_2059 [Cenarchaeum symbiosum A]